MAKLKKELSVEEIEEKKAQLKEGLNKAIEKQKRGRTSPAKEFLTQVQDLVKDSLDKGVSYRALSREIEKVYNFKITEQTIRAFAHNILGIEKKQVGGNKKVENKQTTTNTKEVKENTSNRINADINQL